MLRKIRIALATIFFLGIVLLFVDFTGMAHVWLGWMAKIQFLPAVLALNVAVIVLLLLLTLVFGRVYCSVICPLGIMQDLFAAMGRKAKKNRYSYSKAKNWLRYPVLVVFVVLVALGFTGIASLIAPYSAFGRIAESLLQPLWMWGNNLCAMAAEHFGSYAFYSVDVWMKSLPVIIVAAVTLVVVAILAWRGGRTYCNTICPVGTVLGFVSRFSLMKPVIDTSKCNSCGLCARKCKASCINAKEHSIDYSRCVVCMDCLENCRQGALRYVWAAKCKCGSACSGKCETEGKATEPKAESEAKKAETVDTGRRAFMAGTALAIGAAAYAKGEMKVDGGLAAITDKTPAKRRTRIVPPGALSISNLEQHCTGCQLCISECPNGVLRPSTSLMTLMQPEMSFERGFCRPECTRCADVCPTGAIKPITREVKASTQIGHAVWIQHNCVAVHNDYPCGLCARKCPVGAIELVPFTHKGRESMVPAIDEERCIGCGKCENLCPARPFSAIYVEGHQVQHEV